jgi:hypothetical protein
MNVNNLHAGDLLFSLGSRLCPLCGGRKGAGKTVCFSCWRGVPANLKRRLYCRLGDGYEEAVAELFELAGVSVVSLSDRLCGGAAEEPL